MGFARRSSVMLALLAGCGRVGYAPLSATSPGTDATSDATTLDGGDAGSTDAGDGSTDASSLPTMPTFGELCPFVRVTAILDGITSDDSAGTSLANTIATTCGTGQTVRSLTQSTPGLLDTSTKGPLLGPSELATVGGDDFAQNVMGYLLPSYTPVVRTNQGNAYTLSVRAGGMTIGSWNVSTFSTTHDVAVLEITRDPVSGSLVLSSYGYLDNGTLAGAYYFGSALAPSLATNTSRWYVIEWTEADASAGPSAGDTFVVLGSGS